MKELIAKINNLKKTEVGKKVSVRIAEFKAIVKTTDTAIFKELCFCLLTANFSAHGGIKIQNAIQDGFMHLPEEELAKQLVELGHRFPNMRAKFICEARIHKDDIKKKLSAFATDKEKRNWIAENVKGLGMKEASHFLRNIGYKDVAIIDFHIVDLLVKHKLVEQPKNKSISQKKYIEIENILGEIGKATKTSQGELDLYLWYEETGKILK